jgi:hypothetical protein
VNKGKAGAIELKIYAESVDMNWTTVLWQEQGDHISKRIISATGLRCVIQRWHENVGLNRPIISHWFLRLRRENIRDCLEH